MQVKVTDGKDSSNNDDSSIDDTIDVTINVTDVDEPPPKMAAPTVSKNSTTPKTKLDVSWTALTTTQMAGKPAVDDYDVQYRLHGATDWTDASFSGTGTSTTLTGLTSGKSYEVQVRANNDETDHTDQDTTNDSEWSDSGSAITEYTDQTRSIAENSAAGDNVGDKVDADNNPYSFTLAYALGGTDAGKFSISSTTGQITVGTGTTLDYETTKSYSVTVTMTVSGTASTKTGADTGLSPNETGDYVIPVTINVTDVNEAPEFTGTTAARSIAENSTATATVGAVVTANADPDGDTLYYSLTGTDAATFAIGESTGQITVATGKTIKSYEKADGTDPDTAPTYSVTVNVTDKKKADGTADTAIDDTIAVTITVTDADEPPPAPAAPTVAKNSTTPKTKLDVSWTALSSTDMAGKPPVNDYDVQYRKHGDSSWTSHSFSGTGTSATLTGLDSHKSYEVQVRANNVETDHTDQDTNNDSDWSPSGSAITDGNGTTRSIEENSDAGDNVGTPVTATSNTNGYTLTHTLGGTDAGKFTIASGTGQITVGTGTTLDYETKTSYSVTVTVKAVAAGANAQSFTLEPNYPGSYTVPVTINVTDVDEPPGKPSVEVEQNSGAPKYKLDVSWTAPTMTGKPAITDYDVQYKKKSGSTWTSHAFTGTGTSTTLTTTNLTPDNGLRRTGSGHQRRRHRRLVNEGHRQDGGQPSARIHRRRLNLPQS